MKREKVKEILISELKYLQYLKLLHNVYITPMQQDIENSSKPLIDKSVFNSIFFNISTIQIHTQTFYEQLKEECTKNSQVNVGKFLSSIAPSFNIYVPYLCNFDIALDAFNSWYKSNKVMALVENLQLVDKVKPHSPRKRFLSRGFSGDSASKQSRRSSLGASSKETTPPKMSVQRYPPIPFFLELPQKRLIEYQQLFSSLSDYTDQISQPEEYEQLKSAVDTLKSIQKRIDDKKDETMQRMKMVHVYEQVSNIPFELLSPTRFYIREGELLEILASKSPKNKFKSVEKCYWFLFSDMLIKTKLNSRRILVFKKCFPLDDICTVEKFLLDLPKLGISNKNFSFKLVTSEGTLFLSSSSEFIRMSWMDDLKKVFEWKTKDKVLVEGNLISTIPDLV